MSLMDNLKHLVLTEDDEALKPVAAVRVDKARIPTPGAPKVTFPTVMPGQQIRVNQSQIVPVADATFSVSDTPDNTFAQSLKAKTDFDQTDIGKQVAHEMKPLEGIASLSETDKINIALKAGAEEGLTAEKIIATFDSLLQTLESENGGFQNAVAAATESGPIAMKGQIASLEAQVESINQQIKQLSTDLITSNAKINRNTMQFSAAYEARKSELTSAKSHYQSILAGIK